MRLPTKEYPVTNQQLIDWLLSNGNAIIKWRTINELLNNHQPKKDKTLLHQLLDDENVKRYLDLFNTNAKNSNQFNHNKSIHGSGDNFFENYTGKLYDFGIRIDILNKEVISNYLRIIIDDYQRDTKNRYYFIHQMAMSLSLLGLTDKLIIDVIEKRLKTITDFIQSYGYNYYLSPDNMLEVPKIWRTRKIINPAFIQNNLPLFPVFYDILGIVGRVQNTPLNKYDERIQVLTDFIFSDEYHNKIEKGNGIIKWSNRYFSMGWSLHIPGYSNENKYNSNTLFRALLYSHFPNAKQYGFFNRFIPFLNKFQTPAGTFIFPKELIPVRKLGYWVKGINPGLGLNRRKKNTLEIESTFYMLKLLKNLGMAR